MAGAALRAGSERCYTTELHDRLRVPAECKGVENASANTCSDVHPGEQLSVVARVDGGGRPRGRAHREGRGPGPKLMAIQSRS
jgi:hypothetical protein